MDGNVQFAEAKKQTRWILDGGFFFPNKNYSFKYQTGNGWNLGLTKGKKKKNLFHANLKVYESAPS
ncbi:hypothetical protein I7I53_00080 [Histoplasma capsulatum var. duboisii H88]|uniref:Uncharacterized protein n=1 Tax=Ajellomyces capsulatus (strain H88) TaxID=544711 RepID=A0A8A1LGF0_AJEC8|nr:hypothetical protein I7I53_00080 [Histoplasma capsulatum var. duboisii H88]